MGPKEIIDRIEKNSKALDEWLKMSPRLEREYWIGWTIVLAAIFATAILSK